jgi:uncharacterized protein (TIGR04222 family)
MKPEYVGLWRKISEFSLDVPGAEFPFSARLAKENEWSRTFTRRAIEEYKKFAFLAVVADHPVSPSDAVDQVWHLHLTYTKNYWKQFCGEILGKPLHHNPTEGGSHERDKFRDWYQKTLDSYCEFFDRKPPRDIWPLPEDKLSHHPRFVRVDKSANWVVPKPGLSRPLRALLAIALLSMMAAGCGAVVTGGSNPFNWMGPDFLKFYLVLFPCSFATAALLRWSLRQTAELKGVAAPELDAYSVAYLNQGKVLAVNAAITSLIDQKVLTADPSAKALVAKSELPPNAHPLEKRIYEEAAEPGGAKITNVRIGARPLVEIIASQLQEYGLVVSDSLASKMLWWPLMLASIAPLIGIIKIVIGIARDKSTGFLIALCLISIIASVAAFARRPLRTRAGDAALNKLRAQHFELKHIPGYIGLPSTELALALGLFGMTTLAGTTHADLRKTLQPATSAGTGCGSSCGSGCSGSCGGGGCGGCGGCGG